MHSTIFTDGRQVGVEVSDAVLHTQGEFCGNLHVPLQFDDPVSTETVLKHLRISLPSGSRLHDVIGFGEDAGGLEMIFFILDDPSVDPFPPEEIPDSVELLWLEESVPTQLGAVAVQTVAQESESEPKSAAESSGGSGCAGVLLAMVAAGSVLVAWIR